MRIKDASQPLRGWEIGGICYPQSVLATLAQTGVMNDSTPSGLTHWVLQAVEFFAMCFLREFVDVRTNERADNTLTTSYHHPNRFLGFWPKEISIIFRF